MKHRFGLFILLFFIFIPSASAQDTVLSAGSYVLGMGFLVLLLLLGLMWRVLRMKPTAIPETSAPPRKAPERIESRVYGELIVVDGLSGSERILITKPEFSIGRGLDNNDFEMNLQGVSRQHLVLSLDPNDNRMYIRDLDSVNGTLVNGRPLVGNQNHPLYAGDEITISQVVLRWNPLRGVTSRLLQKETQSPPVANITPEEQW